MVDIGYGLALVRFESESPSFGVAVRPSHIQSMLTES